MSSSGGGGRPGFKLTIKKTGTQPPAQAPVIASTPVGTSEQRPRPAGQQGTPASAGAAALPRHGSSRPAPRPGGLVLKGSARPAGQRPPAASTGGSRIMLKGSGTNRTAAPATAPAPAATPQQAAVPATPAPASVPANPSRPRFALKGSSGRAAAAAGSPATPASAPAAPSTAPRAAPSTAGSAGVGSAFATPRSAGAAATPAPGRASSQTPSSAGGSAQPRIRLKGSAGLSSATPASAPRPAATPGTAAASTAAAGAAGGSASGPPKPRLTLNKSRGRSLTHQQSLQSVHSQPAQVQPLVAADKQVKPEPHQAASQLPATADPQAAHYAAPADYYSSGYGMYDHAGAYGSMMDSAFMSHDYSTAAAGVKPEVHQDPAAAAGGSYYGAGTDYAAAAAAGGAMPAHASSDPAAAAAGGMYGMAGGGMYGMGMDPAAAAATAVVDYNGPAYYQQQSGQKRSRASGAARAAAVPSPLAPRAKRPKPAQAKGEDEEEEDEDFNPKAERARAMGSRGGGGGSGGIAPTRAVKSRGPSGARAHAGWHSRPAAAARTTTKAAAAQKAAHRAAQAAHKVRGAVLTHPQPRAGGGHMSAVVPVQRPKHHLLQGGPGGLAAAGSGAAPRSPVLGDPGEPLMTGAAAAAAFAQGVTAEDAAAALGMDLEGAGGEVGAVPGPAAARGGGGGGGQQRKTAAPKEAVEQVLARLHAQVEYVEETHPPTRETLNMMMAALDKRDKYRYFVKPVTDKEAPGYSSIIKNPMDLSTMRSKVDSGMYSTWSELMADIILLVANAKVYNNPKHKVHKEADAMFSYAQKYVKNYKQGRYKLRGAVAAAVRNANNPNAAAAAAAGGGGGGEGGGADGKGGGAAAEPSGPVTRATRRGGTRRGREEEAAPVAKRARGTKFIPLNTHSASDWSLTASLDGDSARDTYKSRLQMYAASWNGLADGASPEGVPYGGHNKPILRCVAGHASKLPPDMYLGSLSRFVSGAGSVVEKLVMQVMGAELAARLIPIPGVTPAQAPQQAPGQPTAPRPAHTQPVPSPLGAAQPAGMAAQQQLGAPRGPSPTALGGGGAVAQPLQAAQQQQQQQQSLAGLFGGQLAGVGQGMLAGLTPAQLAGVAQLQAVQRAPVGVGVSGAGQQFVPGPQHLAQAMSMGRPPVPMASRQL